MTSSPRRWNSVISLMRNMCNRVARSYVQGGEWAKTAP